MAVDIQTLVASCNQQLSSQAFTDYCPNGLQVQGVAQVSKIVAGVTASQALIDRAIELKADVLLVHHGFFWKGEDPCITRLKYRRLQALLKNDINLVAYHLPLDAHPVMGNNAQLAVRLGIIPTDSLEESSHASVGNIGRLIKPLSAQEFCQQVATVLSRKPTLISGGEHLIETIGWCTGAAQSYIDQAAMRGVDAYLSGEISEPTVHSAREYGVHYIAAGHHATERYGVQALGEWLAQEFGLDYQFIDVDNPV